LLGFAVEPCHLFMIAPQESWKQTAHCLADEEANAVLVG